MKYIFIVEKSVVADAKDPKSPNHRVSAEFLDFLAEKRSEKGYSVGIIPGSLMQHFCSRTFFTEQRSAELVRAFIDVEESVVSENIDQDYFEVARIKAMDRQPIVVSNRPAESFPKDHTTLVLTPEKALELSKDKSVSF